ncbi:hypothetical protein OC835_004046 [Tilletia horrida]|nr:hypothetical protein OC835_004046 [Tilletia horrida]
MSTRFHSRSPPRARPRAATSSRAVARYEEAEEEESGDSEYNDQDEDWEDDEDMPAVGTSKGKGKSGATGKSGAMGKSGATAGSSAEKSDAASKTASKGKGKATLAPSGSSAEKGDAASNKGDAASKTASKGKGKAKAVHTAEGAPSSQALADAIKLVNPAISLQATQATGWTQIEAQHTIIHLAVEQTRLLRVMATGVALMQTNEAEGDRLLKLLNDIPPTTIPAHYAKGMHWAWRFIGSPFVALSAIASTISWVRRKGTARWLAGSRTDEEGLPQEAPVTADRMPEGWASVVDAPTADPDIEMSDPDKTLA